MFKNLLLKYYEIVTLLGESISYLLLFSIGICRYRIIIYLALAGIARAIANSNGVGKNAFNIIITAMALPLVYLDMLYGQLYPVFPHFNIIISVGALIFTVITINTCLKQLVQKITCNEIFTYCLNCKFENKHLVKTCANCRSTVIDFKDVDNKYEKPKSLLNIIDGEYVVAIYHIGKYRGVYKNDIKLQIMNMIITNINTIFINYKYNCKGWSYREEINNNNIIKMVIEKKKHNKVTVPVLSIITSCGTIYELYYYTFDLENKKLFEIAGCIKKQNTNIEIVS